MNVFYCLLAAYAYCHGAYGTWKFFFKKAPPFANPSPAPFFGSIFWPVTLLVGLVTPVAKLLPVLITGPWDIGEKLVTRQKTRRLQHLERTRKVVEEYAQAAGIEGDLANAEKIADVERKLNALRSAESDLVELKHQLESQSEVAQEIARL